MARPKRPNKSRDLKIRRATRRDADAVAELARQHNANHGDPVAHVTGAALRRDFFGRDPVGVVLIAHLDGASAGYAMMTFAYDTAVAGRGCVVDGLYLTDSARKRGVARVMMAAAAAEARRLGAHYLWWRSKAWDVAAQEFYRKLGAVEEPVMAHVLAHHRFAALAREGEAIAVAAAEPVGRASSAAPS